MSGERKTYRELLLDPRWQRRRLEILDLAEFQCANCNSGEKTLHVHHKIYHKGALPWEYKDCELVCLCDDCHETDHEQRSRLNEALVSFDYTALETLLGYAESLAAKIDFREEMEVRNVFHAEGIAAAFRLDDPWDPMDLVHDGQTGRVYLDRLEEKHLSQRPKKNTLL
jgi:hypothetical protein